MQHISLSQCAGSGWDRINFIHNSWYTATFRSVLKVALIIQRYLGISEQWLHRMKPFSPSHTTPSMSRFRISKELEGIQMEQLTPADQRVIPYSVISCSAYKTGKRRRRKKGSSEFWSLYSQVTTACDEMLLSWGWLNTCLCMVSGELIPCFSMLVCAAFALLIKLFLSQPMSSLIFALLIHSPIPPGGS